MISHRDGVRQRRERQLAPPSRPIHHPYFGLASRLMPAASAIPSPHLLKTPYSFYSPTLHLPLVTGWYQIGINMVTACRGRMGL